MKLRTMALMALAFVAFSSFSKPALPTAVTTTNQTTSFDFFRVHRQGSDAALSWCAATTGVDHFLVEKSYDGGEFFEPITTAPALGGTNRYRDAAAFGGNIIYRVSAIGATGEVLFSAQADVRIVRRG
jgi:hypothetical protein